MRQISHYDDQPIGNFLRWAQERIRKEWEMIEESEVKDPKTILSPKKKTGVPLPPESFMIETINSVDELRDKGMLMPEALKTAGVTHHKYWHWRKCLNLGTYQRKHNAAND